MYHSVWSSARAPLVGVVTKLFEHYQLDKSCEQQSSDVMLQQPPPLSPEQCIQTFITRKKLTF